jgi:hypothetical protein
MLLSVLLVVSALVSADVTIVEVGRFSAAAPGTELPDNWKPLTFAKSPRHTAYSFVREGASVVVKAVSEAASSGLVREIRLDPKDAPRTGGSFAFARPRP